MKYVLGDAICKGSFGEVYRTVDPDTDEPIAVKVVKPTS